MLKIRQWSFLHKPFYYYKNSIKMKHGRKNVQIFSPKTWNLKINSFDIHFSFLFQNKLDTCCQKVSELCAFVTFSFVCDKEN